jgi:hypothetical protein
MKTDAQLLACARRELALRRNVYPRWIQAGRLSPEKATFEIECMEQICTVLEKYKMLGEVSEEMKEMELKRQLQQTEITLPLCDPPTSSTTPTATTDSERL